jgi:hypothetical protein
MSTSLEYLSINETNALLKAIDDPRDHAIITKFLTTGLFVNELLDLKLENIDFDNKLLKIEGKRTRQIPLNNQTYESLANWTKHRIDTPCQNLFITTKGKVQGLSVRGIDKLIRKHTKQAGLRRNVNSKVLRNTFAINLFSSDITTDQAKEILGISDYESINRYRKAAQNTHIQPLSNDDLEHTDTRSKSAKLISKIFPIKPTPRKARTKITNISANPEEVIFGRDSTSKEIQACLTKSQSTLLVGVLGIGKTHILKHISKQNPGTIFIPSASPTKEMLMTICINLDPDWKSKLGTRPNAKDLLNHIKEKAITNPPILAIDDLHKLKVNDIDVLITLLKNFTILATTESTTPKLKQLWWKFKPIELQPLTEEPTKSLISYLTQNMSISDYDLLETQLLNLSNGLPLAIVDTTKQLSYENIVKRTTIRKLHHEAGAHYRDWTFAIIVIWGLIVMSRFIALGTHSFEGYILAGLGTSVFMVLKFFVMRMR